jgi:hypothetical protein
MREAQGEEVAGIEAQTGRGQPREAEDHQPRADEEHQGQGDLGHDEEPQRIGPPQAADARAMAAASLLDLRADVGAGRAEGRQQTEDGPEEPGKGEARREDAQAQGDGTEVERVRGQPDQRGRRCLRTEDHRQADSQEGDEGARGTAEQPERDAFRHEQADQTAPVRSQGHADGGLPLPGSGADEEEIDDVDAGDEEHQPDGPGQQDQRPAERWIDPVLAQRHDPGLGPAGSLGGIRLPLLLQEDRQLAACLLRPGSRLQAADDLVPVGEAHCQALGHQKLRRHPHRNPGLRLPGEPPETGGKDADHGQRPAVEMDRPSDDARVRAEAAAPELVADQSDRMGAHRSVLLRQKDPAADGADFEDGEVRGGDDLDGKAFGGLGAGQVESPAREGGDVLE